MKKAQNIQVSDTSAVQKAEQTVFRLMSEFQNLQAPHSPHSPVLTTQQSRENKSTLSPRWKNEVQRIKDEIEGLSYSFIGNCLGRVRERIHKTLGSLELKLSHHRKAFLGFLEIAVRNEAGYYLFSLGKTVPDVPSVSFDSALLGVNEFLKIPQVVSNQHAALCEGAEIVHPHDILRDLLYVFLQRSGVTLCDMIINGEASTCVLMIQPFNSAESDEDVIKRVSQDFSNFEDWTIDIKVTAN